MATNIVKAIQDKLGFASFDKIDPNDQQGKEELQSSDTTDHYNQAATIAVLVGLYKYGTTEDGAAALAGQTPHNPLHLLFGGQHEKVIEAVSMYGNKPYSATETLLEKIARAALDAVHEETGKDASLEKIRTYLTTQRHNILIYLPPDLKIGDLVNDETLEDRTNKMEGPVSNLMHAIEDIFASKDKNKEI